MSFHENHMNNANDWKCPKCNYIIFKSKQYCMKCRVDRNGISCSNNNIFNDWKCSKCNDIQFAKNKNCRKCGTPKPNVTHIYSRSDWTCLNCGDHQFAKNIKCRKCNANKPEIPTIPIESNQIPTLKEDNECIICMTNIKNVVFRHNDKTDGHLCCCETCAYELFSQRKNCPICRSPISELIKIF